MSESEGFFNTLIKRRIPHIFGFFLAGSWTALEFTQWAVGRYALSPLWEEAILVFLLLCLPLILVSAWHHGAPGKQRWSLFEKLFIPFNVMIIPLILFQLFAGQDFGKIVTTVTVTDENGQVHERTVAKKAYKKPIAIFPFKNLSNNHELDSIALITSEVISRDLSQNMFYSRIDINTLEQDLRRSTLSALSLPLSFQINLAKRKAREYFINGSINQNGNEYEVKANLYQVNSGGLITQFTEQDRNYFKAIDAINHRIHQHFFSDNINFTDLPIEDLYTNNWQAFISYAKASAIDLLADIQSEADPFYQKALKSDPTFSQAALKYSKYLITQNGIANAQKYTAMAQQHQDYRLTERERFEVNAYHYFFTKKLEETFRTLDQWSILYPDDFQPHLLRSGFYNLTQENDKRIISLLEVIELDPSQHHLWDTIGDLYSTLGEYEKAIIAYENYAKNNQNNPLSYKNIGDLYSKTGELDSAISHYQQALTISPNHVITLRQYARTLAQVGNLEAAESMYYKAIEHSGTANELLNSRMNLVTYYWEFGHLVKSTELLTKAYQDYSSTESKMQGLLALSVNAWRYHVAGQTEKAESILKEAFALAKSSKEEIFMINIQVGQALLYNVQGRAEQALPLYGNIFSVARSYLQSTNDLQINYIKSQTLFELGQYQEAMVGFEAMNSNYPDQLDIMLWIARTQLATEKLQQAQKTLQHILSIAPAYPFYNFYMGKVYLALEEPVEAKNHLQKALQGWHDSDIEFAELIEARQLYNSL